MDSLLKLLLMVVVFFGSLLALRFIDAKEEKEYYSKRNKDKDHEGIS